MCRLTDINPVMVLMKIFVYCPSPQNKKVFIIFVGHDFVSSNFFLQFKGLFDNENITFQSITFDSHLSDVQGSVNELFYIESPTIARISGLSKTCGSKTPSQISKFTHVPIFLIVKERVRSLKIVLPGTAANGCRLAPAEV